MTYVVTPECIKCKYTDCVEVCPVDCFYEGKNMLVIHPEECIDCGVCEIECPINAIVPEEKANLSIQELNKKYSGIWPKISVAKPPHPEAEKYKDVQNKLEFFDSAPGE